MTTACGLLSGEALAQAPTETPASQAPSGSSQAVALGHQGIELYNKRRWVEAYDKFSTAEALKHSPAFVLYMAHSKRQVGELLAARGLYQRVADEKLGDDAAKPFKDAQANAKAEIARLEKLIPILKLQITGTGADNARVEIDGQAITSADLNALRLDPGVRRIIARSTIGTVAQENVNLGVGARTEVLLTLRAPAPAPRPPATDAPGPHMNPSPLPPGADGEPRVGSIVPGAITLGLGVVGLGVGAVTGAIASGKKSDLDALCGSSPCPESARDTFDSAANMAHASTASFIAGGVLGAAGVTLLIVRPQLGGSSNSAARVVVSPGGASLKISF